MKFSKNTQPISKVSLIDNAKNKSPFNLQQTIISQKMNYSGGFKMPPATKGTIEKKIQISDNPNVDDIYQRLGLTKNSPMDKNISMPTNKSQLQSKLVDSIDGKIERIRLERAKLFENQLGSLNVQPQHQNYSPNVLQIYDAPERKQIAYQQPSSLDAMTLENIEAQLEVHRINLKPLEQRYFQKRGRSPPRNHLTVDQQIEQQKRQLIYAIDRPEKVQKPKRTIDEEQLERLFEQKKRTDPKLAQFDAKFKEYEVQKLASKQINTLVREKLFRPEWNKYQQSHSKSKQKSKSQTKLIKVEKPKIEPKQEQPDDRLQMLEEKYSLDKIVLTKNDKYIAKWIFRKLDVEKKGLISKQELYEYVMGQDILKKDFGIDEKWFYSDLDSFPTNRKGILGLEECLEFLSVQRMLRHPKIELVDPTEKPKANKNQISEDEIKIIEDVFKSLDPYDDRILKRQELIDALYMDPQIAKILDKPAVYIDVIDKSVSVRQIFQMILSDYRCQKNPKTKKVKQYITLNQFVEYFRKWDAIQLSNLKDQVPSTLQQDVFDIEPQYLQLLQDIFNSVPRVYQDYVATQDFLEAARKDPQVNSIYDELCRIDSVETSLPLENIAATLRRMSSETDEFACWQDIKMYFSRRGRPIGWNMKEIELKKAIREQKKEQAIKKTTMTQVRISKKYESQISMGLSVKKQTITKQIMPNYTVPDPFAITDMKQIKQIDDSEEAKKQYEELRQGIKALPVNKEILEPKMEKMQKEREERSKQIRNQSKKRTVENQKPFSFYEKDIIGRALKDAVLKQFKDREVERLTKPQVIKKTTDVSADIKKPYKEVIEENRRKSTKKATTEFQVSENLYPKNPAEIEKNKKIKVMEALQKIEEVEKRKKQKLEKIKEDKAEQNRKKNEVLEEKKKKQQQATKLANDLVNKTNGSSFKPQVNNFVPDPNRQDTRKKREEKENQKIQAFIRAQEQKRKKRLEFKPKEKEKPQIDTMSPEEIIDNLSDIDFQDLIDDEQMKQSYLKLKEFESIPFASQKIRKDRRHALMMRERADMQAEEKRRKQQLRESYNKNKIEKDKERQKIITGQLERTKDKKIDVKDNKFDGTFAFHKSKALRRYRDLIDGKTPLSQYDRLSREPSQVPKKQQDYDDEAERIEKQFEQASIDSSVKEQ